MHISYMRGLCMVAGANWFFSTNSELHRVAELERAVDNLTAASHRAIPVPQQRGEAASKRQAA